MLRTGFFSILVLLFMAQTLCACTRTEAEGVNPLPSNVQLRRSVRGARKRDVHVVRRQSQPTSTLTPQMMDLAQWNADTNAKCVQKLQTLQGQVSNPAGIATCYNIPYTDIHSGTFIADLRLFQVARPDAEWETVGDDFGIALNYKSAFVEESNFNNQTTNINDSATDSFPQLLRVFSFLGFITPDALKLEVAKIDMSSDVFKSMLTPLITLKGTKSDGTTIETQPSINEAAFLSGQLVSKDVPQATPERIPGKTIAFTPIGMILYSAWMVIGVFIVMYGTYERRRYRDQFRKRIAQSLPAGPRI